MLLIGVVGSCKDELDRKHGPVGTHVEFPRVCALERGRNPSARVRKQILQTQAELSKSKPVGRAIQIPGRPQDFSTSQQLGGQAS